MLKNRRKGIATRILSAFLAIALTVTLCPNDMGYVMAEEVTTGATITGVITDGESQPLEGVGIVVTDSEGNIAGSATTISGGAFTIENLNDELSYTLTASKEGYKSASCTVVFDGANNLVLTEKTDGSIAFNVTEASVAVGGTLTKIATGTDGAGDATSYTSSNTGVATVDNSGVITPIATGTTVITATRPENADYKEAKATYTLNVTKGTQTALTWKNEIPTDLTWKDIFENTVTGGLGNGAVTYASSNPSVAEVDVNTGILTLKKPGTVTITATKSGGNSYEDVTAQYTLTINKAKQAPLVFADKYPNVIYVGDTYQNVATGGSVAGTVSYTTIGSIVSVAEDGTITANRAGTAIIQATLTGDEYYDDVTTTYGITIFAQGNESSVKFKKGTNVGSIVVGETLENPLENTAGGDAVTYESSVDAFATVDENGTVTGVAAGSTVIKATYNNGSDYLSYTVIVKEATQTVTFEKGNGTISCGETYTNVATATTTVTYTSSDDTIATVNTNGVVTGLKEGNVIITATAAAENGYTTVSAQYALHIDKMTQTVSFAETAPVVTFNDNNNEYTNLASTDATNTSDNTVKYSVVSGNATVNKDTGLVQITGAGTIIIEATYSGNSQYASASATYTLTVNKASQTISFEQSTFTVTLGNTFTAPIATETGTKYGSGAITYEKVEDVNSILQTFDTATGTFTLSGNVGTATIKASKPADDNYEAAAATYTLTVQKKQQTIVFPAAEYEVFTGGQFDAPQASVTSAEFTNNSIVYTIDQDDNGIISEIKADTGKVTLSGNVGTATIKATKPGDASFAEATATYTLTVKQWTADDTMYTITDTEGLEGDVWFKGAVSIKAKEGYQIRLDGSDDWVTEKEVIGIDTDTTNADISFYVKETQNGYVSTKITESIKKDGTVPEAKIDCEGTTLWDKILSFFIDDYNKTYKFIYSDVTSGVASVQYYIDEDNTVKKTDEQLDAITTWTDYDTVNFVNVDKGKKYVVYAKVTDNAGNYVYASTNGIVHDIAKPVITFDATSDGQNFGKIYSDDIKLKITVQDPAPYSGIKSVKWKVYNDSTEVVSDSYTPEKTGNVTYDDLEDTFEKTLKLKKEVYTGDSILVWVEVEDFSGNIISKEETYVIDAEKPVVTMAFTDNNQSYDTEGIYYTDEKVIEVVVTGRSSLFDAEEATNSIDIRAKDVLGNTVENPAYVISNWTPSEGVTDNLDTHTATITFTKDATYEVSIAYENKMGVEANNPAPLKFVIDRENPFAEINISDDNDSKNVGNIYDGDIVVDINVTDTKASSGIATLEYEVLCDGVKTQEETINVSENTDTYDKTITIDKTKNQGDEIVLKVKATDRCGKYFETQAEYVINTTKPTIDVSFDNNDAYQVKDGTGYFTAGRKATIVFTCRESLFDAVTAKDGIKIEAKDGFDAEVSDAYIISDWSTTLGNKDVEDTHIVTVEFKKDAIYTFDVSYTNELNQSADGMNTGNSVAPKSFAIDTVAPKITVAYTQADNNPKVVGDKGYFNGVRTATITVDEKISFAKEDVNIAITAKDSGDKDVSGAYVISNWTRAVGGQNAGNVYTATVEFKLDANYTFAISYKDKAGHNADVSTGDSITPNNFTVDIESPTGEISVKNKDDWSWKTFLETITFGLYNSNQYEQVVIKASDKTSGIDTVHYYRTTNGDITSVTQLETTVAENLWNEYDEQNPIIISPDSKVVVYARIVDKLGHTTYLCSNGIILEANNPVVVEKVQPEVSLTPEELANTVFSGDVQVGVKVEEPTEDVLYSGLKSVTYQVYNLGNPEPTQEGTLFELDENTNDFVTDWASTENESNSYITVDAEKNHSNSVVVKVIAYDRAGNKGEAEVTLKIDTTAPQISVSFDNNDGDTSFSDTVYFNKARTATITIKEDNFDPSKVSVLSNGASALNWSSSASNANGDGGVHKASVSFASDGDYTFGISCTDKAGRASGAVDYGSSLAPMKFTVDITEPQVTVSYDNNNAANGNYYNETRVATIQVREHNFEVSRVNFVVTATDNGQQAELPALSNWVTNGDTHTATVVYDKDALYTFDFDYTDKAGNKAADIPMDTFYVDKTAPNVSITNIVDESANSGDGNIGFSITATDTNFDIFTPVLTAIVKEGDRFVEKQISGGGYSNVGNGQVFTIRNVDADGIYRISCTVVDKAGNAYKEVSLQNKDGSTYVEERSAADTLLTFSVNRQGSAYELDENTMETVKQYYVQNVDSDVVLVEVNTNSLKEYKVTLNGKELKEGTDYTVTMEGGHGEWMKYIYSIKKSLFASEGQYQVVVSSVDEADNNAFSDVKDATVTFVVDRTAPLVTVSGLETDGRYQVERQMVTIIPTDDGGALKSLLVRTVDEDGKELVKLVDLSGDELTAALDENDGKITFEIEEGLYQNVQIICTDCAIDGEGNTNTYDMTFYQVSVSSSAVKMLFASKGMRYGIIGGIVLIIGGAALLIFRRKKVK